MIEYLKKQGLMVFPSLDVDQRSRLHRALTWSTVGEVEEFNDTGDKIKVSRSVERTLLHEGDGCWFTFSGLDSLLQAKIGLKCTYEELLPAKPTIRPDILPPDGRGFDCLLEFQVAAISACIRRGRGIVKLPTGGGKTEIIAGTCRYLLENGITREILIVEPSTDLVEQTRDRLIRRGFTESEVGVLYGKSKQVDRRVTIATPDTLRLAATSKSPQYIAVAEKMSRIDTVIFDECHSCGTDEYRVLRNMLKVEREWGFSATPFDGDDPLSSYENAYICGSLGGVIFTLPTSYLVQIGLNSQCYAFLKKMPGQNKFYQVNYKRLYDKEITNNSTRNDYIARQVRRAVSLKLPTMISVVYHNHAKNLMNAMKDMRVVSIFGSGEGLLLKDGVVTDVSITHEEVKQGFLSGRWDVIIASPVFDQGFDLSSIMLLVIAGGMKSARKTIQRKGRGARSKASTGLNRFYLLDFIDNGHVYLSSQSKKRKKLYEDEGSILVEDEYEFVNMMHRHSEVMNDQN